MKKHNKFIAGFMALCLAFGVGVIPESIAPVVSIMASAEETEKSGTCGENLTWVLDDEGTLTISGTGDMDDYDNIVNIQWDRKSIKKVIIENGVTSIGSYAFFECSNLTEAVLPDSIKDIGWAAAFEGCSALKSITLPNNINRIGFGTFSGCTSLTKINIPDSVKDIYDDAFSGCTSLTEINIPDSVTYIGVRAFSDTLWLKKKQKENPLVIVNNILIDGTSCSGNIIIPEGVIDINGYAFSKCKNLKSVVIPDSVMHISYYSFIECTGLTEIIIPDSVTYIGKYAFYECTNLKNVILPDTASIDDYSFDGTPWLESKRKENPLVIINDTVIDGKLCSGDVIIPDNVKYIRENAFADSDLTSVTIPDSIINMYSGAFQGCQNLTKINFPDTDIHISDFEFAYCTSLKEITIPDKVYSIGNNSFSSCTSLKKVIIPDSVHSIYDAAFSYCTSLEEVTIPEGTTYVGNYVFEGCENLTDITILNPECYISDNFSINDTATIHGYENSTAHEYAEKYNRKFVSLGERTVTTTTTTTTAPPNTTTTTTTTTIPVSEYGSHEWHCYGGDVWRGYEAYCSYVINVNGFLPVETVEFDVTSDNEAIKFYGEFSDVREQYGDDVGWSNAYNSLINVDSETGHMIMENCRNKYPENKETVLMLTFYVPEDCPLETYTIKINNLKAYDFNGNDISDKIKVSDVKFNVTEKTSTTTTVTSKATTTTTTSKSDKTTTTSKTTKTTATSKSDKTTTTSKTTKTTATSKSDKTITTSKTTTSTSTTAKSNKTTVTTTTIKNTTTATTISNTGNATGDLNGDGDFGISDVVTFLKYILGNSDVKISDWKQADFTGDGVLDSFDLVIMRKKLIEK